MKSLIERIYQFNKEVNEYRENYPDSLIEEFVDYWTEKEPGARLMRFELKKNRPFFIGRRLGTFLRKWKAKPSSQHSKTVNSKLNKYD